MNCDKVAKSVAFVIEDPQSPNVIRQARVLCRVATPLPTSGELIRKQELALQKRKSLVEEKQNSIRKQLQRVTENLDRVRTLNDSFSMVTETKLKLKFENYETNRSEKIAELKTKLGLHSERVRKMKQLGEKARQEMLQKLTKKQEDVEMKKKIKINWMLARIKEHEKRMRHISDFISQYSINAKEKMMKKMEKGMQQREYNLNKLMEKLHVHKVHSSEVRARKSLNQSESSDIFSSPMSSDYSIHWSEVSSVIIAEEDVSSDNYISLSSADETTSSNDFKSDQQVLSLSVLCKRFISPSVRKDVSPDNLECLLHINRIPCYKDFKGVKEASFSRLNNGVQLPSVGEDYQSPLSTKEADFYKSGKESSFFSLLRNDEINSKSYVGNEMAKIGSSGDNMEGGVASKENMRLQHVGDGDYFKSPINSE